MKKVVNTKNISTRFFGRPPKRGRTKEINKKGIVTEYLPWLLIAIIVLVIVLFAIFLLKGKGVSILDQIKSLFRGR